MLYFFNGYRALDHLILGLKFGPIPNAKKSVFPQFQTKSSQFEKKNLGVEVGGILHLYLIYNINTEHIITYLQFHRIVEYIPDKKRNAPLRTVQLSGRSQVIGQFSLYQCKGMSGTAALHIFCNLASKLC